VRIGLISDSHGYLPGKVFDVFADVQVILHAGDIVGDHILDELESIAPVYAVSGNMDGSPNKRRPQTFCGEFAGVKVCMTHGHLIDPGDYNASALQLFAGEAPRIIVHGHSHRAKHEKVGEVSIINPGAACKPRFRDVPSVAIIEIQPDGEIVCTFAKL
jgi:uncharacterized protein